MEIKETVIPGCYEIRPNVFNDARGSFVKIFHREIFAEHGLVPSFVEEYYSVSYRRVLRGMHFQIPPHDHVKLVYCVMGKVMDVAVDLRLGSPTYGEFVVLELSAERANIVYIPSGLAHGFYVLSNSATLIYKATTVYSCENDKGVRWDSVGIPWPTGEPRLSERDRQFPCFADFQSPFVYEPTVR